MGPKLSSPVKEISASMTKTAFVKLPTNSKKQATIGFSQGLIDSLVDNTIISKKIQCRALGINISIGELAFVLSQLAVSLKGLDRLHEFSLALFTATKDIFGKTYMESFKSFAKKVTHFLILCGFNTNELPVTQSGKEEDDIHIGFKSFFKDARSVVKDWNKVCESEFGSKFSVFLSMVFTSSIGEKYNLATDWAGYDHLQLQALQKQKNKKHRAIWLMDVIDSTLYLCERFADCIHYKNFKPIFTDDASVIAYQDRFAEVSMRAENLDSIPKRDSKKTFREFLTDVQEIQDLANRYRDTFPKKHPLYGIFVKNIQALKLIKIKVMDKMFVTSERDPPIGIVVNAPPSAGKSELTEKILKLIYDIEQTLIIDGKPVGNKEYRKDLKHVHCYSDEYESGFNVNHEIMIIDDAGQFNKDITLAQKGGAMIHIIDWINGVPYITAQAELANKGQIPFLCKYVIITTNFEEAGLPDIFKQGGGAWRRLLFVDVDVIDKFCFPGTKMLQGDLDNPNNPHLHTFSPRKYITLDNKNQVFRWQQDTKNWLPGGDKSPLSFKEFAHFLRNEVMYPHYQRIAVTKRSNVSFSTLKVCHHCGVTSAFCLDTCPINGVSHLIDEKTVDHEVPVIQSGPYPDGVFDYDTDEDCATYDSKQGAKVFYSFRDGDDDLPTIEIAQSDYDYRHCLGDYYNNLKYNLQFLASRPIAAYYKKRHDFDNHEKWFSYQQELHFKRSAYTSHFWQTPQDIQDRFIHTEYRPADFMKEIRTDALRKLGLSIFLSGAFILAIYSYFQRNNEEEKDEVVLQNVVATTEHSASKNHWKVRYEDVTKLSGAPSTTTMEQMLRIIPRNIAAITYTVDGEKSYTNALGTHSNISIVPKHFYLNVKELLPLTVDIIRTDLNDVCGPSRYKVIIDETNFIHTTLHDNDMILLRCPEFGTFRDIRPYFLSGLESGRVSGTFVSRRLNGELCYNDFKSLHYEKLSYYDPDQAESFCYDGYISYTNQRTIGGSCGGPYIVNTLNGCYIAGFHVAYAKFKGLHKVYVNPIPRTITYVNNNIEPSSFAGLDLNNLYSTTEDLAITQGFHFKCPLKDLTKGSLFPYGKLQVHRAKMKSQVCPTIMGEDILKEYNLLDYTHHSPKEINSRISTFVNVSAVVTKTTLVPSLIERAKNGLIQTYMKAIKKYNIKIPNKKYDVSVGINGIDNLPYVDRIPSKTSGGFAHRGRKDKYFITLESTEEHSVNYGLNPDLQEEMLKIMACLLKKERPGIIWDYCHKDEPLSPEKILKNKCRIFNSAPLCFTILERRLFLWCIPIFMGKYRHHFGSAVGANATGDDWETIYNCLVVNGPDKIIAGDYKKFDKNMCSAIMLAAFEVLIALAKDAGFSEEDLALMAAIATECCYPMTNVFGSLAEFFGSNPSGHSLTTIINGIVNTLYIMMSCMQIEEDCKVKNIDYNDFFTHIPLITFGDDNIMSSPYDIINHTAISSVLATWGIDYTMADKTSESRPFITIDEAEFLKRKFVKTVDGHVLAPLDETSIIRSLSMCTRSRTIDFEHQCAEIIEGACRAYFEYGKDIFESKRKFFAMLLNKYNLRPHLPTLDLPTYEILWEDRFGPRFQSETRTDEKERSRINRCMQYFNIGGDTPFISVKIRFPDVICNCCANSKCKEISTPNPNQENE